MAEEAGFIKDTLFNWLPLFLNLFSSGDIICSPSLELLYALEYGNRISPHVSLFTKIGMAPTTLSPSTKANTSLKRSRQIGGEEKENNAVIRFWLGKVDRKENLDELDDYAADDECNNVCHFLLLPSILFLIHCWHPLELESQSIQY